MNRVFKMSTEIGSYKSKDWSEKKTYAEMGRIIMTEDGKMFGSVFDTLNNREIKFNAFEIDFTKKTSESNPF